MNLRRLILAGHAVAGVLAALGIWTACAAAGLEHAPASARPPVGLTRTLAADTAGTRCWLILR